MELKEFITNTLTQIAEGVQEAINIADGYTICPTTQKTGKECTIHFDLAIESETEGGASIKVLTGSMKEKSANRVTFDVGMILPSTKSKSPHQRPTYDEALESR